MNALKLSGLVSFAVLCAACGSGGSGGTGGGSGGSGGSGGGSTTTFDAGASVGVGTCTPGAADAGSILSADAGCNQLVNCAQAVKFQYLGTGGTAPTATGGTVADGLYALTAARVYGLASGPDVTLTVTYLKQGDTLYGVGTSNGSTGRFTGTTSFSGTMATNTQTCPGTGMQMRGYSASGDVWLDLDVSSQRTVAYEYTRVK